ncbi:hypothetical protein HY214_02730 [Candidatus Roizmanbacteria bacterium]|nr:hypothetical protein [Candidatus Roizmanbacteria bacterium]
MFAYTQKKLPKSTVEIILVVPTIDVQAEYKKAFSQLQAELAVEGFRKGKVPTTVAEKHLDKEAVYQEMIQSALPQWYEQIVKKENFHPIMSPKVELIKGKDGEDWEFKITLAEKPVVDIANYRKVVSETKHEDKKAAIWTPGKGEPAAKEDEAQKAKIRQDRLNRVLEALLKETKIELPDLLLETELSRRLTQAVDDIQKIGLTVDAYLKSKNLTMDELKSRYRREIEDTYKLEFLLAEIADKENITVENKELEDLFNHIPEEKERTKARSNAYFYATILRKQKVLDFLTDL